MDLIGGTLMVHGALGGVALVSAGVAMATTKGSVNHRRAGKVFGVAMISAVALALPAIVARTNLLLATLGPFSAWLAAAGWRSGRSAPIDGVDRAITAWGGLSVVAMLGLSVWAFRSGHGLAPVPLVLGLLGSRLVWTEWQRIQGPPERNARLRAHVGMMVGATIAATTAFGAVNLPALGVPPLIVWLGPTALGIPVIVYFSRRYPSS